MNCYNSDEFLKEAIDSVIGQTHQRWEIIFWDNQSTDKSEEIVRSYNDRRIRYFYALEHTTLGQARNLAVEKSQGEWCAFLDCDDLWSPQKLEKQISKTILYPQAVLIYGVADILVNKGAERTHWGRVMKGLRSKNLTNILPEGDIFEQLLQQNFIPLVSAMVKRSTYWLVGGIDPKLKQAEDFDLFVKLAYCCEVRVIRESICSYRIHASNLTHTQLSDNFQEVLGVISRYLPLSEAKYALKVQHAKHVVALIRKGRYLQGFLYLTRNKSLGMFIGLIWNKLRQLR